MANIVDERGYNQIFQPSHAQVTRLRRRAAAIVHEMNLPKQSEDRQRVHILEIGCGLGEMAHQLVLLTGAQVTGVDLSPGFIGQAKNSYQHNGLEFIVSDLSRELPASDAARYDYIVGNGILHHLYHNLDSFLPALARWLKPDGCLIFWEPNLVNPYVWLIFSVPVFRRMANLEPDEMAFTSDFIRRKLMTAGFSNIRVCTRDFLLPNTPKCLVTAAITSGRWLERVPFLNRMAQSIFFVAGR